MTLNSPLIYFSPVVLGEVIFSATFYILLRSAEVPYKFHKTHDNLYNNYFFLELFILLKGCSQLQLAKNISFLKLPIKSVSYFPRNVFTEICDENLCKYCL